MKVPYPPNSLFIDVGGSFIKVYSFKDASLHLHSRHQTPRSSTDLLDFLANLLPTSSPQITYLGLPGPVSFSSEYIYLPPLAYSISVEDILNCLPSLSIDRIYNDCSLLHRLIPLLSFTQIDFPLTKPSSNLADICVTVGTSFGISVFHPSNQYLSFELAHLPISILSISPVLDSSKSNTFLDLQPSHFPICSILNTKTISKYCTDSTLTQNVALTILLAVSHLTTLLGIQSYHLSLFSSIPSLLLPCFDKLLFSSYSPSLASTLFPVHTRFYDQRSLD